MKTTLVIAVIASAALLVSATVWEGVTDVASVKDLPGGYSVATNSFPRNTIVDITNLENGKMVRVRVVSGLETTGLLATLSRNAADSLDLRHNVTCRIRMTQPSDDIVFSHLSLGPIDSPEYPDDEPEDYAADENVLATEYSAADEAAGTPVAAAVFGTTAPVTGTTEPQTAKAPEAGTAAPATGTTEPQTAKAPESGTTAPATGTTAPQTAKASEDGTAAPVTGTAAPQTTKAPEAGTAAPEAAKAPATAAGENPPEWGSASGRLALLPAEERAPSALGRSVTVPEENYSYSAQPAAAKPLTNTSPVDFSPFQAPLITRLEPGKWYVQVGVYTRADNVEDEISRIGMAYPLAIQNVGTDTSPMFRVLLGPLNQGESGAMLQRFKSIGYTDAFVRHN